MQSSGLGKQSEAAGHMASAAGNPRGGCWGSAHFPGSCMVLLTFPFCLPSSVNPI